jgi:hypothetical protein
MARMNVEGADINDCLMRNGNRYGVMNQTITANLTIGPNAPHVIVLTPDAARNVLLPANPQKGDYFFILNTSAGAFALTIQDSAGGALSPAVSVAQSKSVLIVATGTPTVPAWKALAGA